MQDSQPRLKTGAVISFLVTALVASILLVSVAVLLLGELIGSHILAMALLGVVIAVVSWVIYHRTISPVFRRLEQQIDSVIGLTHSVQRVFQCVIDMVISKIVSNSR